MLSALESETKKLRPLLVGGTAIGSGLMPSLGRTGLTTIARDAAPAALRMESVWLPSAADTPAVRLKLTCVALEARPEMSRAGSAVDTCAPASPVPVI